MLFEEPTIELIKIERNNIITQSTQSCTSDANANPNLQGCSTGAPHGDSCADESYDWVD